MFSFLGATLGVCSVMAEEQAFRDELAAMPEDLREAAIQRRNDLRLVMQRQREHAEMIEALKPHNLWSFLGLGSK